MSRAILTVPPKVKRGEVFEIKAMVEHSMETGFRRTQLGDTVPRNIITHFVCSYDGAEIFRADLHPAISANPLFTFTTVATTSGKLEFRWTGDNGFSAAASADITVV